MGCLVALAAMAVLAALLAAPAAHGQAQTRYSIAGGCFGLTSATSGATAPGAGMQRFQATDLGSYLLYGPAGDYLAATGGSTVGRALNPSPATDWKVEAGPGSSFTLSPLSAPNQLLAFDAGVLSLVGSATDATRFRFAPAGGCASFPDAELNVSGTPARGSTPYGEVEGFMDGHMHWTTFEYFGRNFHCGRPWHRYGIPAALPDCSSIEGPLGALAPTQNFLNYGNPVAPHSTAGWPTLDEWGRTNLTYEGIYHRWMQRVWMSGLRLIVMPLSENRTICTIQQNRASNCNEMDTVFRSLDRMYEFQDYVDAQAGGPGKGFFRIVRDPVEARRAINEGKMAVVLEVEISEPFGCSGGHGIQPANCDQNDVDDGLDQLYDRGVRSMLLLNKYDNPLTGVRFDSGTLGAFLNAGNLVSGGSFWTPGGCSGPEKDNAIDYGLPSGSSFLGQAISDLGVPPGTLPLYGPPPHCNTRGLTELGEHTVKLMMDKGMIVNPDHMSQKAVDATLSIAEDRGYSGLISPHGWMDPRNWPRIWNLGGMAFPSASGSATNFVNAWRDLRPDSTPFYFGWGYGADLGGLARQPAPLSPGDPNQVTYPFDSLMGDTTVERQHTGMRTFDYPTEGVAHYGLYAEYMEEVRKIGGEQIADDLLRGPEAYLQMWERASGMFPPGGQAQASGEPVPVAGGERNYAAAPCLRARQRLNRTGLGSLRLGLDSASLLQSAGQPLQRNRAWTYCVNGRRNARAAATAVLTPEGSVALVASDAAGHTAKRIGPGAPARKLRGHAKPLGAGIWRAKLGRGTTAVWVVRGGTVRTVAGATGPARSRAGLREYLGLVPPRTGASARASAPDSGPPLTDRNAVPLRMRDMESFRFVCDAMQGF